jgi:hypothetical protein
VRCVSSDRRQPAPDTDLRALATLIPASGYVHGAKPTSIDAGIYAFIANIYFYDIDTPLKQFAVAHDNIRAALQGDSSGGEQAGMKTRGTGFEPIPRADLV